MGHGGRYILDSLKTGAVLTEYYTSADLMIGSTINVWGRKLMMADCDEFTKEYYVTKYGVTNFTPIEYIAKPAGSKKFEWPPYTGFGSEEDSLCSCMGLLPKPPKRDFIKFMEKDRHGLESNILRFTARLDTNKPINMDRRFIISYFLSDDTIAVFEPPVRNSGIIGGKFLERARIKKPDQPRFGTELSEYFTAGDLYVGSRVNFYNHFFILIDADEYAFRFMEKNPYEFSAANINMIIQKLGSIAQAHKDEIKEFFRQQDPQGSGLLDYEQFRNLLSRLGGSNLSEHEIMTIGRFYSNTQDVMLGLDTLVAIAQQQLKKCNFENFTNMSEGLAHHDTDRSGFLDVEQIRSTCNAFRLPLPDDLLRAILAKMESNEEGSVSYITFIKMLNWIDNPSSEQFIQPPQKYDDSMTERDARDNVQKVNYINLLQAVFAE